MQRSGTFSEISERGYGTRDMQFTEEKWYDRGGITVGGSHTHGQLIPDRQLLRQCIKPQQASQHRSLLT